jgi:hypothetical protein
MSEETLSTAAADKDPLTPKQRKFVQEYLIDLNATAAARRAGYSAKTANELGYKVKRNPAVAQAIAEALAEQTGISKAFIVDELAQIARGEVENTQVHDRLSALDKLGRILGMFKDSGGPLNATQIVINLPDGADRVLYGSSDLKDTA